MAAPMYLGIGPLILPVLKEGGQQRFHYGCHWRTARTEQLLSPPAITVVSNQMIFCFVFLSLT